MMITALRPAYVAGIQPHTSVWTRRNPPPPVRPWSGRGRPTSRMVRDPDHQPRSAEDVALSLPAEAWQTVSWREGSADVLSSAAPADGGHAAAPEPAPAKAGDGSRHLWLPAPGLEPHHADLLQHPSPAHLPPLP